MVRAEQHNTGRGGGNGLRELARTDVAEVRGAYVAVNAPEYVAELGHGLPRCEGLR